MKRNYKEIGQFDMKTSVMRISDPCYSKDVWCTATIDNCATGTWDAAVGMSDEGAWGTRVGILMARHQNGPAFDMWAEKIYTKEENGECYAYWPVNWSKIDADIGVDAGCCGLYDDSMYQHDEAIIEEPEHNFGSRWYNACCDIVMSSEQAGVLPGGCVSNSGFGDGGYTAFHHVNADGETDAVCILYI